MREWVRSRLNYANVTATLALFLVISGGTAAAVTYVVSSNSQVGPNTIAGHHPPSGRHSNLIPASVNGQDVADNSLRGADIDEATLAKVLRFGGTIPSGVTVRGVFGCFDRNQDFGNTGPFLLEAHCFDAVTLPLPAPQPLTDANVNFAPGARGEDDPTCTGSVSAPTAPAGQVCVYESGGVGDSEQAGAIQGAGPSVNGFEVRADDVDTTNGAVAATGTWAYKAP
jgi:hypothetical protein